MNYISKINRADFSLNLEKVNLKDFIVEREMNLRCFAGKRI